MTTFLVRLFLILILFMVGTLVNNLTGQSVLAIPVWFIGITTWTLLLNFRKALFIIIPFLVLADVLWDGRLGPVFLGGFLLATGTTYLAVRIETRSWLLQTMVYSFLISIFSLFVLWASIAEPSYFSSLPDFKMLGELYLYQLIVTALLITPLSGFIHRAESWLDTSYKEQYKKIR